MYGRPSSNYNFLQIPPNLEVAENHAFSRTAALPVDYEVEHREKLQEFEKDKAKYNYREP